MEVTKENFSSTLPEVLEGIEQCAFIAFDTEFTGLHVLDRELKGSWADQPEERYQKQRKASRQFSLVQVGLCLFFRSQDGNPRRYSAKPYNFYVFPSSQYRRLDRRFMCQPSSLTLLAAHGTDFNKWIVSGIPYMNEEDEEWWRAKKAGEDGTREVTPLDLNMDLGFTQVIHAITNSGKPLVGHNIMLDVLHLYSHFIAFLPETLAEFKTELHRKFPRIYDTKVVVNQQGLKHLVYTDSLPDLYSRVQAPPFPKISIVFPPSFPQYSSTRAPHEAAYDAYITGYSLLAMALYIAPFPGEDTDSSVAASNDLMTPFADQENRVFLYHCEGTSSVLVTGDEPLLSRDHMFHMSFPKEMDESHIKNLFSPFGGCRVCWINSTSAHIIMFNTERVKEASDSLVSLGAVSGMTFHLSPYTSHQADQERGRGCGFKRKLDHPEKGKDEESRKVPAPASLFDVNADWPQ